VAISIFFVHSFFDFVVEIDFVVREKMVCPSTVFNNDFSNSLLACVAGVLSLIKLKVGSQFFQFLPGEQHIMNFFEEEKSERKENNFRSHVLPAPATCCSWRKSRPPLLAVAPPLPSAGAPNAAVLPIVRTWESGVWVASVRV